MMDVTNRCFEREKLWRSPPYDMPKGNPVHCYRYSEEQLARLQMRIEQKYGPQPDEQEMARLRRAAVARMRMQRRLEAHWVKFSSEEEKSIG